MRSTYIDGFTVNTTTQDIRNSRNKNENICQPHLKLKKTNSYSYCFYSTHDFHKFIGEQTVLSFKINLNDITLKSHTHTHTHTHTPEKYLHY